MAFPYSVHKTYVDGETLTASDLNATDVNHVNNNIPESMDDYSIDVTEQRTTSDPDLDGAGNAPTTLAEELEGIRHQLARLSTVLVGGTYWYNLVSTTQLLPPVGSASAPYIAPSTDPDTGPYGIGANDYGISIGGTGAFRIDSSARFTLGNTTGANARLLVKQTSTNDFVSAIALQRSSTADTWGIHQAATGTLTFGFATNASGADANGDFTTLFSILSSGGARLDTGTFNIPDGSVGSPSLTFKDDQDNGAYRIGSDNWGLTAGGNLVVDIGTGTVRIKNTANLHPNSAGSQNFGNATDYWGDISYKTLTDRGCLPWCDDGVELADGTVVSDIEALEKLSKHPTKKTIHGLPMLNYKTFPKKSYRPADKDGKLIPRDKNDEPIEGQDGVEMTMLFGVMIGAFKEMNTRLKTLESK